MRTVEINSINEYVTHISEHCLSDITLFRGQRDDNPLIPKVARLIYKSQNSVLRAEKKLISEFKRLSLPYLGNHIPRDSWEWISIAQHHGLPTRLLDWSTNALAALFFAIEPSYFPNRSSGKKRKSNGVKQQPVVWIFEPSEDAIIDLDTTTSELTPWTIKKTRVFKPAVVATRLNAQQGWFTVHAINNENVKRLTVALESQAAYKKQLTKLVITGSVQELRANLHDFGIHRGTLFPDLDGLSSYLTWRNAVANSEFTINFGKHKKI